MLEVMRDYFKLNNQVMHREITGLHTNIQNLLSVKGLSYNKLKSALVPTVDRHEVGFIFDSTEIDSSWYGLEVAKVLLPLLDKRTTQSVLCGDLVGKDQGVIFNILDEFMVLARSFEFSHGTALYCVYLNNLSEAALKHLHQVLSTFPAYLGYIPGTYQTQAKTYLSTILVNAFLKCGDLIIMGHEEDRPNEENENLIGYPFQEYGYRVRSLQSTYFDLFLSYKIERAVYSGFEVDTEMALNALTQFVVPLSECKIQLDEAKHGYLKSEKFGKLEKAGIHDLSRNELEALIKEKVESNYIYNLEFLEDHDVIKFNVIMEIPEPNGRYPTRLMVALEYKPHEKILRVITLY